MKKMSLFAALILFLSIGGVAFAEEPAAPEGPTPIFNLEFDTVGPDATSAAMSPGMSETMRLSTLAGAAIAARRPPFTFENRRLTAFIAVMGAPEAKSVSLSSRS